MKKIFRVFAAQLLFCGLVFAQEESYSRGGSANVGQQMPQDIPQDQSTSTNQNSKQSDKKLDKKEDDKPVKLGVIASNGSGAGNFSMEGDTGGAAPGDESSPISGSVNRKGSGCVAVIKNGGNSNYSVNFHVISKDKRGNKKKKFFSASVASGKSAERSFSCSSEDNFELSIIKATKN